MKLLLSISIAAIYGVGIRLLYSTFSALLPVMSISFFFIVPFFIGYLTILLLPYRERHTSTGAFFKPWLTVSAVLLITFFCKIEGLICWVMAFPLFAILAGCGGLIAFNRKRRRAQINVQWDFDKDDWEKPGALKSSLLLFIPLFAGLLEGKNTSVFENITVEDQIEIRASPDAVWAALTTASQTTILPRHSTLTSLLGFPHHLGTNLDRLAIGGKRVAVYQKGLRFDETITRLEPGNRLTLTITTDASQISKAIMDEHIVIGGEHIQMQEDNYTLQRLPSGGTRLSLSSRFSINTPFNWYARLWANWLMSDVISEELQSISAHTYQIFIR